MAKRTVAAEQGIGPQIGVSRKRAMVAVFTHGSPSSKQRPDRAKVIPGPVIDLGMLRNDPHTPVGLVIFCRESGDGLVRVFGVGQTKPHGNRSEHAGLIRTLS